MEPQRRDTLTGDDLQRLRWDSAHLTPTDEEPWLIVRCNNGQSATVRGAENLWRLVALANEALPEGDPRKITSADAHLLYALVASIEVQDTELARLLPLFDALGKKLGALLHGR